MAPEPKQPDNEAGRADKQGARPAQQGLEIDPQTGETRKTPEQTAFEENLQKSRDDLVDRIEKLKSDKFSPGKTGIDERATLRMQAVFQKQIEEIDELFNRAKQDFATRTSLQSVSLDVLATELKKNAETAAGAKVENFENTVKRNTRAEEYITTDDVYNIEVALLGAEKALKNPHVAPLLKKLQEIKELDQADYAVVVELLDPNQIWTGEQDSYEKSFEATIAGALIHLMKPDQRFKLVEQYMDSKKDGLVLLDKFISTGVITREQAEIVTPVGNNPVRPTLFQIAVDKGLLTRAQYDQKYALKFRNKTYERDLENLQEIIHSQQLKDFAGQYEQNVLALAVGMPLVGGILAVWGTIFLSMNLLVNRNNLGDFIGTPQAVAGVTGLLLGTEIMTGSMQKGAGWGIGSGAITHAIDSFSEANDEDKQDRRAKLQLTDLYNNSNPIFRQYLDYGGFTTLQAVRKEKTKAGKTGVELVFNLDELIAYEDSEWGSEDRVKLLKEMKEGNKGKPEDYESKLTAVPELALNLKLDGKDPNTMFSQVIKSIREGNRPGSAPATQLVGAPVTKPSGSPAAHPGAEKPPTATV